MSLMKHLSIVPKILTKSIILEGTNGAGKTTLARDLSTKLNVEIVKTIKLATIDEGIAESEKLLYSVQSNNDFKIYDRVAAFSSVIYNEMTKDQYIEHLQIAAFLSKFCIVIFCTGKGKHDIIKPHYDDELKRQCAEEEVILRLRYNKLMNCFPHLKYDFARDNVKSLINKF